MSAIERVPYDEFSYFKDNATEVGIAWDGPPKVRRVDVPVEGDRSLSALVWGTESPEIVFLHGGAQNAHTWDTVALALNRPLVAIDLPGHGHSDGGKNGSLNVFANAEDIAIVIRELAPDAQLIVGVDGPKAQQIANFINGPESFPNFDELLARTIEFNPTRTESSLRRGILHNALQLDDGSWVWRYRRMLETGGEHPDFSSLWEVIGDSSMPILLARGMLPQSVVDDADEAELSKRRPDAQIIHVEQAGHSIQGDQPVELARILEQFLDA